MKVGDVLVLALVAFAVACYGLLAAITRYVLTPTVCGLLVTAVKATGHLPAAAASNVQPPVTLPLERGARQQLHLKPRGFGHRMGGLFARRRWTGPMRDVVTMKLVIFKSSSTPRDVPPGGRRRPLHPQDQPVTIAFP